MRIPIEALRPVFAAALFGWVASCALVIDSDFDKYETAAGAGGAAGAAGSGASAGQAGAAGVGGCEPRLTLNEIQTAGDGAPLDEFVELHNAGTCPALLDQYVLAYRSSQADSDHGVTWTGNPGIEIAPGARYVLGGPNFSGPADAPLPNNLTFGAVGGGLALRRQGDVVDQVGWGDASNGFVDGVAAPAPADDQSIGRMPDGEDTDDNAADFAPMTPSPGEPNGI